MDGHSSCVVDTSLLIDMYVGNIISEFFKLPYNFHAPDVIIAELKAPDGQLIRQLGLHQGELTGQQVLEVLELRLHYRRPSVNDLFALVYARSINATLLTNDGNLRKVALQEGIPTHGTLWVLDEMLRLRAIAAVQAAQALQLMRQEGSRFPTHECEKRLAAWIKI